jgi:hypothetical protein
MRREMRPAAAASPADVDHPSSQLVPGRFAAGARAQAATTNGLGI